jgi:hypothetical protein
VVNRFVGWFILLAFAATGALIVKRGNDVAFRVFLLTYAAAIVAIVAFDLIHVLLNRVKPNFLGPIDPTAISGFSQNRNSFAFQILMAMAAAIIAADKGSKVRIAILSVMMAGLFFSGSRSGWIALAFVLGTGTYVRAASVSEIAFSIIGAAALIAIVMTMPISIGILTTLDGTNFPLVVATEFPPIVPAEAINNERLISMIGGLRLFAENPIFGAGLGAFRVGIVGFLMFAVPAVWLLVIEVARARWDPASKLIVICMVAFAMMSAPADMLYQRTFWLLMGAALAMPLKPAASRHGSSG